MVFVLIPALAVAGILVANYKLGRLEADRAQLAQGQTDERYNIESARTVVDKGRYACVAAIVGAGLAVWMQINASLERRSSRYMPGYMARKSVASAEWFRDMALALAMLSLLGGWWFVIR
jgi:hypothetical protein